MGASRDSEGYLERAIGFLASGMIGEALREANAAAAVDPSVRPRALIVARMCIRAELENPKRAGTDARADVLTGRRR